MKESEREAILSIVHEAADLTLATIRPDGFPQATTVSFVNDGLTIYFVTEPGSQKSRNIESCNKVSLTIDLPYESWDEIRGLSMGAIASRVTAPDEMEVIGKLMLEKFPQIAEHVPVDMKDIAFIRITPKVVSMLDYSRGFGHTEEFTVDEPVG